jgi:hypothetical protein
VCVIVFAALGVWLCGGRENVCVGVDRERERPAGVQSQLVGVCFGS